MAAGGFAEPVSNHLAFGNRKRKILSLQEYSLLSWRSVANLFPQTPLVADMLQQADLVGFGSLPIVLSAVFFTGAALALNSATTLSRFGATTVIGQLVFDWHRAGTRAGARRTGGGGAELVRDGERTWFHDRYGAN